MSQLLTANDGKIKKESEGVERQLAESAMNPELKKLFRKWTKDSNELEIRYQWSQDLLNVATHRDTRNGDADDCQTTETVLQRHDQGWQAEPSCVAISQATGIADAKPMSRHI